MIDIARLRVVYGDGTCAVDDLSFHVAPGERVALIGENGAGKTTVLLSILGIVPAAAGSIRVGGTALSPKTAAQIRQTAGLLFQNPDDQLFTARVYDDVAFGPRNCGMAEDEVSRRVEGVLGQLRIGHLKDKMPHRLSGGEKRSVSIACVLAMEPSVLLFDEPTSSLDPRARKTFMECIAALPHTQLIATHDLDMALGICGRALIMQKGKLRAQGNAGDILTDERLLKDCGLELPLSLAGRGAGAFDTSP